MGGATARESEEPKTQVVLSMALLVALVILYDLLVRRGRDHMTDTIRAWGPQSRASARPMDPRSSVQNSLDATGDDHRSGKSAPARPRPGGHLSSDEAHASESIALTAPTCADKFNYPALALALKPSQSSFDAVVTSRMYRNPPFASDTYEAGAMRRFHPKLIEAFTKKHGAGTYLWCLHINAAAALTTKRLARSQRVWVRVNPTGRWKTGEDILASAVALNQDVDYYLRGSTRAVVQQHLYELLTTALVMLDARVKPPEEPVPAVTQTTTDPREGAARLEGPTGREVDEGDAGSLKAKLAGLHAELQRAAKRTRQVHYLSGMAGASVVVAAATVPLLVHARYLGVASAAAGAAGAVVSTVVRVSHKDGLRLDSQIAPGEAFLLGVFRTMLGVAFGVLLYLILRSGLVSVAPSNRYVMQFYAALAFASGFSERLVGDTLGVVGVLMVKPEPLEP
jgi:hypothetical protein